MQSTLEEINERLKHAPQDVLERILGYIDAMSFTQSIPDWQRKEVLKRVKEYEENPDKAIAFDKAMESIANKYK
ncbi:addiction module protein [Planktosalinus lacus]|uniref:Uncharacterized protein n=1 Tax=Planktosalinus lacus TaxID=1526573 RepID=A0A8J2V8A9_9FLAO|nr:addiction module protein [Planktosalinus lacus]GGD85160.1 hypothetical protein GCM10011312_06520 [Planktosalinus lacus]